MQCKQGESNTLIIIIRLACPQQPNLYLEPKWLRYKVFKGQSELFLVFFMFGPGGRALCFLSLSPPSHIKRKKYQNKTKKSQIKSLSQDCLVQSSPNFFRPSRWRNVQSGGSWRCGPRRLAIGHGRVVVVGLLPSAASPPALPMLGET